MQLGRDLNAASASSRHLSTGSAPAQIRGQFL